MEQNDPVLLFFLFDEPFPKNTLIENLIVNSNQYILRKNDEVYS